MHLLAVRVKGGYQDTSRIRSHTLGFEKCLNLNVQLIAGKFLITSPALRCQSFYTSLLHAAVQPTCSWFCKDIGCRALINFLPIQVKSVPKGDNRVSGLARNHRPRHRNGFKSSLQCCSIDPYRVKPKRITVSTV